MSSDFGANLRASRDDLVWATLAHLAYFVLPVFGPLVVWLVKKDDSPFVALHSKEALNFQITAMVVLAACLVAGLLPLWFLSWIPRIVFFLISLAGIVYSIVAAIQASTGVPYRYPFTFRFIP